MISKKTIYFSLLLITLSCNTTSEDAYKYSPGLIRFLNEESNIAFGSLDKKKMLFVDISCEECIVSKLDFLKQDSEFYGIQLYLLGDTLNSAINETFKPIVIGYDIESKYHLYETGISMPLLLDIDQGIISKYFFVNDFNQLEIIEYLRHSEKD